MIAEGKSSVSLFNVQSEFDKELQKLLNPQYKDFQAEQRPEWWEKFDKSQRREMSFQNENIPPVPMAEDFFAFPFRHISATIVGGGTYKATDFSKETVLRRSTDLLTNVPAYTNHYLAVGNEIGFLGEATWRRRYTNTNGDVIPGGIEAPFIIDSVLHGELVRKMNSPVSPIDSASVTVVFNWVASHEFEDERDFYWHLGEMVDDEMVRRKVEEIVQYEESSLVWAGADPYAKMLSEDGQVVNIDRANAFAKNKFSQHSELTERDWAKKYFVFDCLDKSKFIHLSKATEQYSKPNDTVKMNKELLIALAKIFNTTEEAITKGTFTQADLEKFEVIAKEQYTKIKADASSFEAEKTARATAEQAVSENKPKVEAYDKLVTTIKEVAGEVAFDKGIEEIKNLATFKKENEEFAKHGKAQYEALKTKAKEVYNSFSQGNPDQTIVDKLEAMTNPSELESHIKMWGGKLAIDFQATCTKCGNGDNIKFQKSETKEPTNTPTSSEEHIGLVTRV